jgi:hypothetical protein
MRFCIFRFLSGDQADVVARPSLSLPRLYLISSLHAITLALESKEAIAMSPIEKRTPWSTRFSIKSYRHTSQQWARRNRILILFNWRDIPQSHNARY